MTATTGRSPHTLDGLTRQLPEGAIGTIEADQFCQCGYNLHSQFVSRDERLGFAVVRCPECGVWHPAGAASTAARQWMTRLAVLVVVSWALALLAIGAASVGIQTGFNVIAYEDVFRPSHTRYYYGAYDEGDQLFWQVMFLLMPLTLGTILGALQSVAMWHIRGYLTLVPMVLVLGAAVLLASIGLKDHYIYGNDDYSGIIVYAWLGILYATAAAAVPWAVMLAIGRPVARAVVLILIPPRPRQFLSFLWTADGKELPSAASGSPRQPS